YLKAIVIAVLFLFLSQGCALTEKREQINLLKSLGENQNRIQRYVFRQETLFSRLSNDIKNNQLKNGIQKAAIISRYGDPIYCEYIESGMEISQSCLYRHPTKYFSSDMIYLYFDKSQNLSRWELKPAENYNP
ncbi:MAG: hypothetical protein ABH872_04750, partial [Candidatus Omnitrophota bacterium]